MIIIIIIIIMSTYQFLVCWRVTLCASQIFKMNFNPFLAQNYIPY